MPFSIVRQDITKMTVDAIVNAANTDLQMGGGVCGAIFQAAGAKELQAACAKVAPIKTGCAAITPGFALGAKYVIHAAGPIYNRWSARKNEQYLYSAYASSLALAKENDCESIAFPLISAGIYGFPKDVALRVATSAIRDFLAENDMDVFLVVFDRESVQVGKKLLGSVDSYIDEFYVETHTTPRTYPYNEELRSVECTRPSIPHEDCFAPSMRMPSANSDDVSANLADVFEKLDEPFSVTLLRLIDAKGKTDVEVYKKANIDRKLFSKIRTGKGYMPSKRTILALAVALELSLAETDDLLERAGYALSHSVKFDVIVEYFILKRRFDIFEINEVLFQYDQQLLGG